MALFCLLFIMSRISCHPFSFIFSSLIWQDLDCLMILKFLLICPTSNFLFHFFHCICFRLYISLSYWDQLGVCHIGIWVLLWSSLISIVLLYHWKMVSPAVSSWICLAVLNWNPESVIEIYLVDLLFIFHPGILHCVNNYNALRTFCITVQKFPNQWLNKIFSIYFVCRLQIWGCWILLYTPQFLKFFFFLNKKLVY